MIAKIALCEFTALNLGRDEVAALVQVLIPCAGQQPGFVTQRVRYSNQVPARDLQGDSGCGYRGHPSRAPARVAYGMGGLPITCARSAWKNPADSGIQKRAERVGRAADDWALRIL